MKISVFTVITPEFTPEEVVKRLAHLRYEGVEWRVVTVLKENEQETSFSLPYRICPLLYNNMSPASFFLPKVLVQQLGALPARI